MAHFHKLFGIAIDQLLIQVFKDWSWSAEDLRFLTRAAIVFRYPGESATKEEAAQAFNICTNLRQKLLTLFQ